MTTGLITSLACQNLPPFEAALGVYLHGSPAIYCGPTGAGAATASDLVAFFPMPFYNTGEFSCCVLQR